MSEGKNYTEESVSYDFAITQVPLTITAEDDFDDRKKENITTDSQRGQVSDIRGVLTGSIITKSDLAKGGTSNDGLSHWVNDNGRYQLLYKDGTYAKAAADGKGAGAGTSGNDAVGTAHEWVPVNGNWWAFGEDSYAATG